MGNAAAGFIAAFGLSRALGGPLIRMLRRVGARQTVSTDAPSSHMAKQGTPTMGGLLIVAGLCFPVIIDAVARPYQLSALGLLAVTLAFGLIGFLDDFLIATRGKNLGLKARQKLALQFLFAILFVVWLSYIAVPGRTTVLNFGALGEYDPGRWYYVLGVLLMVGLSNAINFLDGLDGLAGGVTAIIALALAAMVMGSDEFAWLGLFGGALAGACCGFLWYNCHPAQVFMGDTGSLALGAAVAGMMMMGKVEVTGQYVAIVPWLVLASVMIQVTVFKYRKRRYGADYAREHRVFRRTPLHHHFEEIGWPETKIVQRFWLATGIAVALTLALTSGR